MIGVQEQISAGRSVQLASILRAQYSSAKISLPVNGGLYARFKHVQGVPAQSSGGYSLSKLQMIDLMVERLVQLRGERAASAPDVFSSPAGDVDADRLMQAVAEQLHSALESADTSRGFFAPGVVESGMMFSLVA